MKRFAMTLLLSIGLTVGAGCSGFGSGFKHGFTGAPIEESEKSKPGYDLGVIAANLAIALTGYLTRHVQDKVLPKKKDTPPTGP